MPDISTGRLTERPEWQLALLEATLAVQAITLNAMFTQLTLQASRMTIVDHIDRFTRLGFKAQTQCRATIETLALMKNPPGGRFCAQANIANGPQQVNNNPVIKGLARAEVREPAPNKLLERDRERLDQSTSGETLEGDPKMAALGEVYRATHAARKSSSVTERVQRRRASEMARASSTTQRGACRAPSLD